MKKSVLFINILLVTFSFVRAQDLVVFRNGEKLQAKVIKVGEKEISYRRFDSLDATEYVIDKNTVHFIKFQNGWKRFFKVTENKELVQKKESEKWHKDDLLFSKPRLQSNINIVTFFGGDYLGFAGDVSIGVRINRQFFVGMKTGVGGVNSQASPLFSAATIPLATNCTFYLPFTPKIYAHFNFSTGMSIYCLGGKGNNYLPIGSDISSPNIIVGHYMQAGLGVDVYSFSLGSGYRFGPEHMVYFKIGVRLIQQ